VTLRTFITYIIMSGFGYNWREKLFYAVAWTPKATVQAALSSKWLLVVCLGSAWLAGRCAARCCRRGSLRRGSLRKVLIYSGRPCCALDDVFVQE
jgi:hypothetical protein